MKKWISCNEQLPDHADSVLTCDIYGGMCVGWYTKGRWKNGFSHADNLRDVAAWMPLPEPYKVKEKQNETD